MMTMERYLELEHGDSTLTQEERDIGWYFCDCFDGMLVNREWPEGEVCNCRG